MAHVNVCPSGLGLSSGVGWGEERRGPKPFATVRMTQRQIQGSFAALRMTAEREGSMSVGMGRFVAELEGAESHPRGFEALLILSRLCRD